MPSAFHGISTMTTALRAFQRGLDVTGHNITNVNTAGYTRQHIDFGEADPTLFASGANLFIGNGVLATSVNRIRDGFLAARRLASASEDGRLASLAGGLRSVESVMLEPGGASIGDALDKFFNAWSALGSNPSDSGLRQQVQQAGFVLTSRVRGMYGQLQTQAQQAEAQIQDAIGQAQSLVDAIANINGSIRAQQGSGALPNDLMDMRDRAIQQLADLMPVTVIPQPDGTALVFSGQITLVDSSGPAQIPTGYDVATGSLTGSGASFPVTGGKLAGLFGTLQKTAQYQGQLDSFANTLRTEFNSIHATGINGLGGTGVNFFADVTPPASQTGAVDFALDAAILADPRSIATGVSGSPGDGGLALSMSALRESKLTSLGGRTFTQFYGDLVAGVGQDVAFADHLLSTSNAISRQIDEQIQSVSGVSIDDEMANMLRFQRSYQAAAKTLSVLNQTTEELINLIR